MDNSNQLYFNEQHYRHKYFGGFTYWNYELQSHVGTL